MSSGDVIGLEGGTGPGGDDNNPNKKLKTSESDVPDLMEQLPETLPRDVLQLLLSFVVYNEQVHARVLSKSIKSYAEPRLPISRHTQILDVLYRWAADLYGV